MTASAHAATLRAPLDQTTIRFQVLPRAFYERRADAVARDLLGRFLVHDTQEGPLVARIIETEAYMGPEDKAAHVYGGRRTARTEIFWARGGHVYMYLIYGMHECFNVVTGRSGEPSAALVRAVEPVYGTAQMAARRGLEPDGGGAAPGTRVLRTMLGGPGRLTKALGLTRAAHYGHDLRRPPLTLRAGEPAPDEAVATSPRIGIDYAEEWVARPLRFAVRGHPLLSKP